MEHILISKSYQVGKNGRHSGILTIADSYKNSRDSKGRGRRGATKTFQIVQPLPCDT